MTSKGLKIKLSPAARKFFEDKTIPSSIRLALLKKSIALKNNPHPPGAKLHKIGNTKIYRLKESGSRILYTVDNKCVTILVVLIVV